MSVFGSTVYEQEVLGDMIEEIMSASTNGSYQKTYEQYKLKYEFVKGYSLIIGSDDEEGAEFYRTILAELNRQTFYDAENREIIVEHPFSNYKNIIYLSNQAKSNIRVDSSVFVDSNSMGMFRSFYTKQKTNSFIDFKHKHNIDLNYLPYILEDYVNPHHVKPYPKKTLNTVKAFEVVNNLDYNHFVQNNELQVDTTLLNTYGYMNIDELVEDKMFYFQYFIDKKKQHYEKVILNTSPYFSYISESKFDVFALLSDYYFIFGYILKILTEKLKDNSLDEKIQNLLHQMVLNGRNFKQILEYAYDYFQQQKIDTFFNYKIRPNDKERMTFEEVVQETHNKSWDIFLYLRTQNFVTNPRNRFNEERADIGMAFFLTQDKKFFKPFVEGYKQKVFVVNENIKGRPFVTMNEKTEKSEKVEEIIYDYYNTDMKKKMKLKSKRGIIGQKHMYALSILFKEQMERELKNMY